MAVKTTLTGAGAYFAYLVRVAVRGRLRGRAGAAAVLMLVASLLLIGLFYVWTRMQLVQVGYEIAEMEKKTDNLKNRQRELLLEITSLQNPAELEKQAREKAGLAFPDMGKVVHVP